MENKTQLRRTLSSSSDDSALTLAGPLNWKGSAKQRYARSVYGGAGGHNTRISAARYMVGAGNVMGGELFAGNEKLAMQNLNDRLANYLERVRSLEQSNSQLELQIRQWYETNTPSGVRDYSAYYKQIEELRGQVRVLVYLSCILCWSYHLHLCRSFSEPEFEVENKFYLYLVPIHFETPPLRMIPLFLDGNVLRQGIE